MAVFFRIRPERMVAPGAYFIGVGAIILSGLILTKTAMFAGDPTPFVMELPIYHIPAWKNVIIHAWDRCKAFVQKAGTVIFVSSALIWFLSSYNWKVDSVEQNDSMLASIDVYKRQLKNRSTWRKPSCT